MKSIRRSGLLALASVLLSACSSIRRATALIEQMPDVVFDPHGRSAERAGIDRNAVRPADVERTDTLPVHAID